MARIALDGDMGGSSGAGGTGAAGVSASAAPALNRFQGGSASAIQFSVVVPAGTGGAPVPKCAPSLSLPRGSIVEVLALPGNHTTGAAYTALTPGGSQAAGSRAVHGVGYAAQVYHNLQNLCELWVYADTVGDGVLIRVTPGRG